jgi:hypothetical protein
MEKWRNDPEGIWTRWIEAFPGSGRQHPLAPGEAVFVATDAIDHREFITILLDLSGADFEFIGSRDVDNPGVPNMVTLGDEWSPGIGGHGLYFNFDVVAGVAEPVDVSSLVKDNLPVNTPRFWRIPKAKILDVVSVSPLPAREALSLFPPCPQYVNATFDRQRAQLVDVLGANGIQRLRFTTLADGRKILQRTKTSSRDFVGRAPSPGVIPF